MKHTELPWLLDNINAMVQLGEDRGFTYIVDCESVSDGRISYEEEVANAAFIVKAVNSHYQLLEALKYVCALYPEDMSDEANGRIGFNRKAQVTINEAREAIKQAEAE